MKSRTKYSRRQVVMALVGMLEAEIPIEHVAKILANYLVTCNQARNIELYLRDIELAFVERFGLATAHVSTARKLSQDTRKKIQALIANSYNVKKVELVETIDSSLIGGVVIKTADAELDGSILAKLQQLRSI